MKRPLSLSMATLHLLALMSFTLTVVAGHTLPAHSQAPGPVAEATEIPASETETLDEGIEDAIETETVEAETQEADPAEADTLEADVLPTEDALTIDTDTASESETTTGSSANESLEPDDDATAQESPETEGAEETAQEEVNSENAEVEVEASQAAPTLTASERIRRKLLIQGDNEYQAGNIAAAQALYQQAKDESWLLPRQFFNLPPEPFTDETLLRPGAAVYWRESQTGVENQRPSQARSALSLLTSEFPEFVPGNVLYASVLRDEGELDAANQVIEAALTLYPDNTDLLIAQVELMMHQEEWLEAAIASRQFVVLIPDHAAASEQAELAAENLSRFQGETREKIRNGAIANLFTGVLGYAFTGSIFGPFTAANSAILLLQGENAVGSQYADQIERQLPMLQHPEATAYVSRMGARLAAVTGRRDLDYEFYVILDPTLNAFALPGGKIFVNAGAILDTRSEAELAGLLAHELAHSVLSHGFQLATRGNLTSSVAQYLPYGGLINNVFMSGYSRTMERQADIVGTQMLASSGYAADGVYNLMVTLNEQAQASGRNIPTWLSTHPDTSERVEYLKTLVERGGYNRYAYEGVATHEEIQAIVARELAAFEAEQNGNGNVEDAVEEAIEEREQRGQRTNLYDAVERFDW